MSYIGYPFIGVDERTKLAVWQKGRVIDGHDPRVHRQDVCGNWMQYDLHGSDETYGWEIDHIVPRARGGKTQLPNLQPLWWHNNRRKGDQFPWSC